MCFVEAEVRWQTVEYNGKVVMSLRSRSNHTDNLRSRGAVCCNHAWSFRGNFKCCMPMLSDTSDIVYYTVPGDEIDQIIFRSERNRCPVFEVLHLSKHRLGLTLISDANCRNGNDRAI